MSSTLAVEKNTRRIHRVNLALPIRIEVKVNNDLSWDEVTRLTDVSAFGAGFRLRRPVKRGRLVLMTIPLPRQLRFFDYMEPQYRVWALVRHCIPVSRMPNAESYAVGVAFIGKYPPNSFVENPAKLYDLNSLDEKSLWKISDAPDNPDESKLPADQRRHSRFPIPVSMIVEKINDEGDVIATEMTVTENISLGGAAVFTSLDVELGSFIRVKSDQYNVAIISVVRNKRVGSDGIPRLHIEFIDRFFPLEGIE